ncbi:hypothetical protein BCR34DRAFT_145377 [Clohesyomyces aquaticus]|uniref:Uncharacterized protein n=1 Tax=Clohesyomyces aquaticus TaxID=1231657 RepID=A0A1Y2A145_9PLEO|nr:hypothetical protein BCR34DRAFT_145377 [Clohesyomyces aquaticus]
MASVWVRFGCGLGAEGEPTRGPRCVVQRRWCRCLGTSITPWDMKDAGVDKRATSLSLCVEESHNGSRASSIPRRLLVLGCDAEAIGWLFVESAGQGNHGEARGRHLWLCPRIRRSVHHAPGPISARKSLSAACGFTKGPDKSPRLRTGYSSLKPPVQTRDSHPARNCPLPFCSNKPAHMLSSEGLPSQ